MKYEKLSSLLEKLVDAINKNQEVDKILEEIKVVSKQIGGKVLKKFFLLEESINSNKESKEILEACLELKNELWEL